MKTLASVVCLALIFFVGHSHAQILTVTTTGFGLSQQCVYANGNASIATLGCSGQKHVVTITADTTLDNTYCGWILMSDSIAYHQVTMATSPLLNCEITFVPGLDGFYVTFPNPTYASLPAYPDELTQWTILDVPTFRTNNASVSLIYNGKDWEQSAFSSPIYQTASHPLNAEQVAHGQVHFLWNSSTSMFQLCESNGPGGLIVDGTMRQVPPDCLAIAQSETTSSNLNYFYAEYDDADIITVSGAIENAGYQLAVSDSRGTLGDIIYVYCYNIAGAIQANIADDATVIGPQTILLNNTPLTGLGTYTGGGTCRVTRLVASLTNHTLGTNGVQQMTGDVHYTLVGICEIGVNNSVSDTSTQRDCASWYNRGLKTCMNNFTTDQTTSLTSYTELDTNLECDFVTWGAGDPAQSDLPWSITGMVNNNTASDGAAVTAGFDGAGAEMEQTALINPSTAVTGFPFAVKGTKSGLSEGYHVMQLLGKAIDGGAATVSGNSTTSVQSSFEISIPQ
jgi:hypothetical protein